jgi:GT2 family glycosyltransferase
MSDPYISFIIPLYNHLRESKEMLASLLRSLSPTLAYEVILVDDGSTDGTREWLGSLKDAAIKVLFNSRNSGYAASNNIGAKQARGELLGLLNNDLLFEPGWLEPMLDIISDPYLNAGIVGNLQYGVHDEVVDHAGIHIAPSGNFDHIRESPIQEGAHARSLAVTGACVLIRREDYTALDGFDESFRNGGEDCDLCYRLRGQGKQSYVANQSRVRHHVSLSRGKTSSSDEINSRLLQSKWRSDIKFELTNAWFTLFAEGGSGYQTHLDGELRKEFLGHPFSAASLIAENILRRREHYWARLLDDVEPNQCLPLCYRTAGLRYVEEHKGYLAEPDVLFFLPKIYSARNFYVCGYTLPFDKQETIELTLQINGIQQNRLQVGPSESINFGVVAPLLLPGSNNLVSLSIDMQRQRALREPAHVPVVLTHIVVDDRLSSDLCTAGSG